MAILSFKNQFVPSILSGEKSQTIRAFRKIPIKTGERLYLYKGLRTKHTEKIGEAICKGQFIIEIKDKYILIHDQKDVRTIIGKDALDQFAKSDGFSNWKEMHQFWIDTHSLPFKGVLIQWYDFKTSRKEVSHA